mmetsp:Transcript_12432/g.27149  ORF Transcript_12432/g.27149 Transcript_12432/m.27149 type:complete len:209 (+) Transcript_12432:251-877(+)
MHGVPLPVRRPVGPEHKAPKHEPCQYSEVESHAAQCCDVSFEKLPFRFPAVRITIEPTGGKLCGNCQAIKFLHACNISAKSYKLPRCTVGVAPALHANGRDGTVHADFHLKVLNLAMQIPARAGPAVVGHRPLNERTLECARDEYLLQRGSTSSGVSDVIILCMNERDQAIELPKHFAMAIFVFIMAKDIEQTPMGLCLPVKAGECIN